MAHCKSSTLVYGETGVGKTDLLGTWVKWLLREQPDGRIRLITAEPQGLATIQYVLDAGVLDVWDISGAPYFQQTLQLATQGYWPKDVDDLKKGWIKPDETDWSKIIGVAHEGVTAFSYLIIEELKDLGAKGQITGSAAAPARYKSGELLLAGANETMYGSAQQRILKAISSSHTLPVHVFWTALEKKVQDKDSREFSYGPEAAGKAATRHIPPKFGSTIHLARVVEKEGQDPKRVAFFDQHYLPDDPKVPYLAQIRVPSKFRKDLPRALDITNNPDKMIEFFDSVSAVMNKATAELLPTNS